MYITKFAVVGNFEDLPDNIFEEMHTLIKTTKPQMIVYVGYSPRNFGMRENERYYFRRLGQIVDPDSTKIFDDYSNDHSLMIHPDNPDFSFFAVEDRMGRTHRYELQGKVIHPDETTFIESSQGLTYFGRLSQLLYPTLNARVKRFLEKAKHETMYFVHSNIPFYASLTAGVIEPYDNSNLTIQNPRVPRLISPGPLKDGFYLVNGAYIGHPYQVSYIRRSDINDQKRIRNKAQVRKFLS